MERRLLFAIPIVERSRAAQARAGILLGFVLWLALFNQLRVEWSINPLYAYGWGVPFLMLYLLWKRWDDRPPAQGGPLGAGFGTAMAAGLVLLFPIRLAHEANPDWRLITWAWAVLAVSISVGLVWAVGGPRWGRHFMFPIAFGLLAVPWPTQVETLATQQLMRLVTSVTAEGLNWFGIGAVQRGNLIELGGEALGVEEACSGVRSLQTHLMVALFAGELFRLSVGRRVVLVGIGLATAVGLNMIRTGGLAWTCVRWGAESELRWHDRIGFATLIVGVLAVWMVGRRLARGAESLPTVRHSRDTSTSELGGAGRAWAPRFLWAAALWLVWAEVGTLAWYRLHETNLRPHQLVWRLQWPEQEKGFKQLTLPERTQLLLRCDELQSGVWRRDDGAEWTLFFLRWEPGRIAAQLASGHTPDVCLAATGFRSVAELGLALVDVDGLEMPFTSYEFEGRGGTYFVFFCLMDDRGALTGQAAAHAAENYRAGLQWNKRWQAVREGRRHGGQQVLEIAMRGYSTRQQAVDALRLALPELIQFKET